MEQLHFLKQEWAILLAIHVGSTNGLKDKNYIIIRFLKNED